MSVPMHMAPAATNPQGSGVSENNLTISGGGLNLNFDLGPNTGAIANGAYNFLGNSFNMDNSFVSNAIAGAQGWLSGILSPVVSASSAQINQNTQQLPSLYASLFSLGQTTQTQSATIVNTALGVQKAIGVASINASAADSQAASNSGGGCFITTAVCEYKGLPDDCDTLQTLRHFRDTYMQATSERRERVRLYYREAPGIVAALKRDEHARDIFAYMYSQFIVPAVRYIKAGYHDDALDAYTSLFEYAWERAHVSA